MNEYEYGLVQTVSHLRDALGCFKWVVPMDEVEGMRTEDDLIKITKPIGLLQIRIEALIEINDDPDGAKSLEDRKEELENASDPKKPTLEQMMYELDQYTNPPNDGDYDQHIKYAMEAVYKWMKWKMG